MSISPNIPVTNTILDFIKELKKYNTAKEAIKNIFNEDNELVKTLNLKSKQGFIYELLWDISIKFNITELTDVYEPHNNIHHSIGNINNTNSTFKTINDFFNDYLKQKYISGNSGGYSDITFTTKEHHSTTLYLSSAKFFANTKLISKYDIQNLCTIIKDRETDNFNEIKTLLFVKDKKNFIKKCKDANQSSNVLIRYISPNGNYENVYDLNDLEKHYTRLYKILKDFNFLKTTIDIDNFNEKYLKKIKKKFIPRFHQDLFIEKIKYLIHKDQKKILVGAIPRSGKTFIMAGTILADVIIENKKKQDKIYNNYVIITPAPNETLDQYFKAFDDYYDFMNNDIVPINVKDEKEDSDEFKGHKNKHNVFLISKQRLGFKDNIDNDETLTYNTDDIKTIKKNIKKYFGTKQPRIIFFDEAHFGMSTSIAQNIFKELDKEDKSYKIYVTATYSKPKQIYGVTDGNIIKWDLNDIKMIKNIKNKKTLYSTISNFQIKFGTKILNRVLTKNGINNDTLDKAPFIFNNKINTIIDQYKHFPEPYLITSVWDKNFMKEELKLLTSSTPTFGFDMHKLFMSTKNNQFANKEQLIQLLEYYFGYLTYKDDTPDYYNRKNEYKKRGIIPIIEEVCTNYCRTLQPQHKTTQLWFLPPYNISKIVRALLILLNTKFNYIFESYMFYIAVDDKPVKTPDNIQYMSEPKNIKSEIEELEKKLYTNDKYKKYNGLIILAGNRLQLGISLKNVDIVSLFTNITASDAIYQMLFRSMTEIDDDIECDGINYCGRKRYGFMVDLNPQRTLYTIDYLTDMYLDYNNTQTKTSKYELIADLINIDKHKFIDKYNREDKKGYQKYVKEFFDKLITEWDTKSNIITDILVKSDIFDNEVFTSNFDITTLFTKIENVKGFHKKAIHKPDDQLPAGKTKETKKLEDVVKKEKKPLDIKKLWANLFAEIISILSLITSYSDDDGNECIFNNDSIANFIYYIDTILKKMEESDDKTIKEIFLYTLKKRIITNNIDDDDLYNMIYNIILILNDKEQSGGTLSDINKQIEFRKRVIYNIKEPDKLLEFINDNLKPKLIEKQERGEVFTPIPIVNEMLDTLNKLPKNVWENKDLKWLDPAAGMGNFPVAVYMRLMKGLETVIKDEEARRKHILTEMLYMVELDKTNVFMMKKIFCGKTYKLNIFQGSFIEGDYDDDIFTSRITLKDNIVFMKKIKTFASKFDIVIGNPPYNDNKESPIYHLFIEKLLNNIKPIYILLIVPSRWFSGGKGLDTFRNMMLNRTDIKMIKHYDDSQEVFGSDVDIKGGVNYFLIDKNYNGLCEFNGIDIKLNRYEILIYNPDIYTLIDKIIKYPSLSKIYERNYYNINTNDKRLVTEKVNDNYILCYVNQHMGFKNYIDKKLITKDINIYKVLVPEASGKGKDGFGNIFICEAKNVFSSTYISFDVKNKKEADSLVSYLKCKLANFMLSLKKNTQHISEKTIDWIPLPPLDRIWTDESVYEYFKITSKEKKLINDNTKDIK
jgi:site-specific DNA-methyltransferase (adenine-specific)